MAAAASSVGACANQPCPNPNNSLVEYKGKMYCGEDCAVTATIKFLNTAGAMQYTNFAMSEVDALYTRRFVAASMEAKRQIPPAEPVRVSSEEAQCANGKNCKTRPAPSDQQVEYLKYDGNIYCGDQCQQEHQSLLLNKRYVDIHNERGQKLREALETSTAQISDLQKRSAQVTLDYVRNDFRKYQQSESPQQQAPALISQISAVRESSTASSRADGTGSGGDAIRTPSETMSDE